MRVADLIEGLREQAAHAGGVLDVGQRPALQLHWQRTVAVQRGQRTRVIRACRDGLLPVSRAPHSHLCYLHAQKLFGGAIQDGGQHPALHLHGQYAAAVLTQESVCPRTCLVQELRSIT